MDSQRSGNDLLECPLQNRGSAFTEAQRKQRYLVMFTMNGHVFTKTYNSIRELRADTGKKPSQIRSKPTSEVICKILKNESTE